MGSFCSTFHDPLIQVYDCIPPGDDFEYLRLHGSIRISVDRKHNILVVDIRFDGWYKVAVFRQNKLNRENIF